MFPVLHGKGPGLSLFIPTIYRDYCQGKRIAWDFDVFIEQVAFIVVINAVPVVQLLCHADIPSNRHTSQVTHALVPIGICTLNSSTSPSLKSTRRNRRTNLTPPSSQLS
ncbi:hypothetical protein RRG08_021304 [Elysia crispata]|uniref:Uncharacterized protein n=1 Tax=Elysia crispata TaxID=231223 RepID=A0AAE0ZAI9_9GAST|nr:hypothetical protein RRG08_021304 [Elysia crispata]